MADQIKTLKRMLDTARLKARKQDRKILLYNSSPQLLSRGVLVEDLTQAQNMVSQYLTYLRTVGNISLNDFAAEHQYRPIQYQEVPNQVDEQSAYFINKVASLSSLDSVNLLIAAKKLKDRVLVAQVSRQVSEDDLRLHRKLKKAASKHLLGAEIVTQLD